MTTAERFGQNVREWRNRRRMNQDVLGELIGSDGSRISKLENGGENPTLETLDKIADALRVDVGDLLAPRPENGAGLARSIGEGSSVLDRAIIAAKTEDGTWRADVAEALNALARALGRDIDRDADTSGPAAARR